jgi:uncharacterized protein
MEIVRPADASSFLELAGPLLTAHEARNNLILGIAGTLVTHPEAYRSSNRWVAMDDGHPVAAALRTPPYPLVLADAEDPTAIVPLLAAVRDDDPEIPGLTANEPFVGPAAAAWVAASGAAVTTRFGQGVFELRSVNEVPRPDGAPRVAGVDDRVVLLRWSAEFEQEALAHRPLEPDQIEQAVESRLAVEDAALWLWEVDDRPVSMAGYGGPTGTGIRVGPVYTPPELRGKGYATALVADMSRALLERGYRSCYLYTDLANPTSNAIYERIGYRKVADAVEIGFGPG